MGLMFSFMQTMMKPSVQSRPCDDIQIDYGARKGRLAGVARDFVSSPISSEDTPPRGPPMLGMGSREHFRRLQTIDARASVAADPNVDDGEALVAHGHVPALALMDQPSANGSPAPAEKTSPSTNQKEL